MEPCPPRQSSPRGRLTAVNGVQGHACRRVQVPVHLSRCIFGFFSRGPGGRLSQIAELRAKGAPHARPFRTPHCLSADCLSAAQSQCMSVPADAAPAGSTPPSRAPALVLALVGLPGAGKSSAARAIADQAAADGVAACVLSLDAALGPAGAPFDPAAWQVRPGPRQGPTLTTAAPPHSCRPPR